MRMRTIGLVAAVAVAVGGPATAQNPRGTASTDIAGKKVSVDYGRPALKGRPLDALMKELPPDRIWRAGENQVTTLTTEGDLLLGGKPVPAGKYSLYVHAGEKDSWSLILNKDPGVPLGQMWAQAPDNLKNEPWPHLADYTKAIAAKELLRVPMAKAKTGDPVDLFTISFTPKAQGAEMTLAWGAEAWSVDVLPAK